MSRKTLFWFFFAGMLALLAVPSWILLDGLKALLSMPAPDAPLADAAPIPAAPPPAAGKAESLKLTFTTFSLLAPQAQQVSVAGDFNLWRPDQFPMKKDRRGRWTLEVPVPPGRQRYRFRVDGTWLTDPANPDTANGPDGAVSVRTIP